MSKFIGIRCDVCHEVFIGLRGDTLAKVRTQAYVAGWVQGYIRSLQDLCPRHAENGHKP